MRRCEAVRAPAVTEAGLMRTVRELARSCGWWGYHSRFSWGSEPGYPDDTLWHPEAKRVIWVEYKRENGRLTRDQERCIASLREAGADVFVWRPSSWEEIVDVLTFGKGVAA